MSLRTEAIADSNRNMFDNIHTYLFTRKNGGEIKETHYIKCFDQATVIKWLYFIMFGIYEQSQYSIKP